MLIKFWNNTETDPNYDDCFDEDIKKIHEANPHICDETSRYWVYKFAMTEEKRKNSPHLQARFAHFDGKLISKLILRF